MLKRYNAPDSSSDYESSYSTSESESSSCASGGAEPRSKKPRVTTSASGLALTQLTAMCEGNEPDDSVYAHQAQDRDRVKEVLKTKCCKKKCKKGLSLNLVMKMITLFWALPKVSQDCVLWSMQQAGACNYNEGSEGDDSGSGSEESEKLQHKIQWSIEGQYACDHLL